MNQRYLVQVDSKIASLESYDYDKLVITETGDLMGLKQGELVFVVARGFWYSYGIQSLTEDE